MDTKKEYKGFLIDLDGTVYLGKNRIPTAERFIQQLNDLKIPYIFLTNNASRRPEEVVAHLKNYNIDTTEAHVYTSGMATIDYLKKHHPKARIFPLSGEAVRSQLIEAGFELDYENPDVVVQSYKTDLTYEELAQATLAIRKGATFISTNPDTNLPSERGLMPGSGATMAFLMASTQQEPIIMGKPHAVIMEGALEQLQLQKEDVALIGDNYTTDIKAGIDFGMDTIMVLTGFSTRESIAGLTQPTYIIDDLSHWTVS
ncbi:TIGR01457 family HAD-type hydrolase [Atopobacter phocae]|uniref:TIGR01457 family HAD-type hydrolase n=1 Tax=Atopobacter phocae TaxID=136492 RepID=UPI000472BC71|nr:TIGR01457 family HAD-type hydrolase [Atopobacter phocae]